jgi:hypothetical protein
MPIPLDPSESDPLSIVVSLFLGVHSWIREEISDVDDTLINVVPMIGANSISTIVTHLTGSEAETLRTVVGLPVVRDRDAEFEERSQTMAEILKRLDEADSLVTDLSSQMTPEMLTRRTALPSFPSDELRPGMMWLVANYGHAREHLGQIQITKQLTMWSRHQTSPPQKGDPN